MLVLAENVSLLEIPKHFVSERQQRWKTLLQAFQAFVPNDVLCVDETTLTSLQIFTSCWCLKLYNFFLRRWHIANKLKRLSSIVILSLV